MEDILLPGVRFGRVLLWFGAGIALAVSGGCAVGQQDAAAVSSDPLEFLNQAAEKNGLFGAEMKPWHLKATFESLDGTGKVTETGAFEEWWLNPTVWKQSYTSGRFAQVVYRTQDGTFRTGTQIPEPLLASQMQSQLVAPFLPKNTFARYNWAMEQHDSGGSKLVCVSSKGLKSDKEPLPADALNYCFDSQRQILRISARGVHRGQFLRNSFVQFQGRYQARDMQLVAEKKTIFRAHIDSLEGLEPVIAEIFIVPADAKRQQNIKLPTSVGQGRTIEAPQPIYPPQPTYPPGAEAAHVSGVVVIEAEIGVDGHIYNPVVVSGPDELRQAAMDSLKRALYKPFKINGEPAEVQTTLVIGFHR